MLLDDLRASARSVFRARAVTAVLLTSLAIGTGANATVFGAIRSLLFRAPAGIDRPDTLVSIHTSQFGGGVYGRSSYPDYTTLRDTAPSFESIAAVDDNRSANATSGSVSQRVRVAAVTSNFFQTLGMSGSRGGVLAGAEPRQAVISHFLWQAFGAPDDVSGTQFELGGEAYTIAGVAPEGFRGLSAQRLCDVWVPLAGESLTDRGDRRLSLIARRRVSLAAAQDELHRIDREMSGRFPETNLGTANDPAKPREFTAVAYSPLDPEAKVRASIVATIVGMSVALLLVSACVNAGSLLLSRAFARRRELAVKMALGAPRARLVRQLLFESVLLTSGGAALGLLFAYWMGLILPSLFAPEHAALLDTGLNPALILTAVVVAAVAGCVFGIAPALHSTSAPAVTALRADAGGVSEQHGGRSLRAALVTFQVALSTLLLLGTGVMIASLSTALEGDSSLPARQVVIVTTETSRGQVSPVRGIPYNGLLERAMKKVPGVAAVGWASTPPLGVGVLKDFRIQAGARATSDAAEFAVTIVSPEYFSAVGMPVIEGRVFDARDTGLSETVVVIDEVLARQHFGATAAGQFLVDHEGTPLRIIGVVRGPRQRALQNAPRPTVFQTLSQEMLTRGYVFIRTTQDAAPLLDGLERSLNAVPGTEVDRPSTLQAYLAERLAIDRMLTVLVGTCGVLALILSMIGVYGVMIDAVQRRTREIGLRVALGAARFQVARLVLTEAILLSAAGIITGLVLTVIGDQLTRMFLEGVAPLQVKALFTAPAILSGMVAAAAVVPLRRALGVSPTIALKAE